MALRVLTSRAPVWLAAVSAQHVATLSNGLRECALDQRRATASTASTSCATPSSKNAGKPLLWQLLGPKTQGARHFSRRRELVDEAELTFQDMLKQQPPLNTALSPSTSIGVPGASEVSSVSQVIFDSCWRRFEEKYWLQMIRVPREVVWLNGAPGSGKGANTHHILQTRGLEHCISMSDLLEAPRIPQEYQARMHTVAIPMQKNHPDSRAIINRGDMIPDKVVGDLLLEALLINNGKVHEGGVLVDGFPRTSLQVDFLKLLNDKLNVLHTVWANTSHESQFPRPLFKVVMLYVAEETSILRQMARAQMASLHNERVMDAGAGELLEQRATDVSVEKCKKRYAIFKQHYAATLRLKQFFPFHLIDAMGTIIETQEAITTELRYQSSLDLGQETYQAIRHLPEAQDLVQHARQQLVSRLDVHCEKYPHLFQKVIDVLTAEIMPILRESGMSGQVEHVSDMRLFTDHPRTAQMLIDILTDRGFKVSHSVEVTHVPVQFDMSTGLIKNRKETKHRFNINWDSRSIRDWHAIELDTRMAESAAKDVRISQSFMPTKPQPPRGVSAAQSGSSGRTITDGSSSEGDLDHVVNGS